VNRDISTPSASLRIARQLLASGSEPDGNAEPAKAGVALQRTCARVSDNLRDAMGEDGSTALLARALARTEPSHPPLKTLSHLNGNGISLDGVAASIDAHGVAATTAAIEALLAALIEVLGRLIGEDMAVRLIEHGLPESRSHGAQGP
jgi:hypothetical protein